MYITFDEVMSFKNKIGELQVENDTLKFALDNVQVKLDEVRAELLQLKADNDRLIGNVNTTSKHNKELQYLISENVELKKENEELIKDKLQAVNDDYNNDTKVHNEYADGLLAEIKDKDEALNGLREDYAELKDKLKDANNNNMKYLSLKEYKAEASEYFHHNPQCSKLFFFMIEGNKFDEDGDYSGSLYVDDCIVEFDNV